MSNQEAVELFNRLMEENNLEVTATDLVVRRIQGGSVIVEQPQIVVGFRRPAEEPTTEVKEEDYGSEAAQRPE